MTQTNIENEDMRRLRLLPRRDVAAELPAAMEDAEGYYTPHATWELRPHQALALYEARRVGGGLLPMGVGAGKSLLAHTLGLALGVDEQKVVVLVPGGIRREYARQRRILGEHFRVQAPHVISYEKVGHPSGAKLLAELAPDLVIADEAHYLSNKDSARTARFLRWAKERQGAFVAMSASLLRSSLKDFAHLSKLALADNSPVPHSWNMVEILDRCCADEGKAPPLIGYEWTYIAKLAGAAPTHLAGWAKVVAGDGGELRGQQLAELRTWARLAIRDRLLQTRGVVGTEEPSCDVPIHAATWRHTPEECDALADANGWHRAAHRAMAELRLPCGQEIESAAAARMAQRTLRLGYYTRWADLGDDTLVDREWAYARRGWASALNSLVAMRREGIDSPALAQEACERIIDGDEPLRKYTAAESRELHAAADALRVWEAARGRYHGRREALYLPGADQYWRLLLERVARWASSNGPTLVWAADQALYRLASEAFPTAVCWPGQHPGQPTAASPWRLVSVASHGTGLNLQPWQHNLLLSVPGEASNLEQLIGRTHRPGQAHPHVGLWLMPGDDLAEQTAQAEQIFLMTGQKQRLTSLLW